MKRKPMKMRYVTANMGLLCLTANTIVTMDRLQGREVHCCDQIEEWREQYQRSKQRCR